ATNLPDNRVVIALFTDADLLSRPQHRDWSDRLLCTRLIGDAIPIDQLEAKLHVVPAASGHLSVCVGAGWLAIGDACLSRDPCSGLGITSAIASALDAAGTIAAIFCDDRDALQKFAERATLEHDIYRKRHLAFYRRESRWPESQFWKRRHNG